MRGGNTEGEPPAEAAAAEGRTATESVIAEAYGAAGLRGPHTYVWCRGPVELAAMWASRLWPSGRNVAAHLHGGAMAAARRAGDVSDFTDSPPHGLAQAIVAAINRRRAEPRLTALLTRRRLRTLLASSLSPLAGPMLERAAILLRGRGQPASADRCARLGALVRRVGWLIPHEGTCWVAEPCRSMHADALGRLHNPAGAALEFADGWSVHAWKGVVLPGWVIEQPARLTTFLVDHPYDAWVRRCMIDILTPQRFIAEGGANCFVSDETGRLWRRHWWNPVDNTSDAWAAVEVVNGTPEPDGSHKHYFLQTPPEVRSPREAVAWTYGMSEQQYATLVLRT